MIYRTITPTGRERDGKTKALRLTAVWMYVGEPHLKLNIPGEANIYFTGQDLESMFNEYHRARIHREQLVIRGLDAIRDYESAKRECFDTINKIVGERVLKL